MKNLSVTGKFLSVLALLGVVAIVAVGYMSYQLRQTAYEGAKIAATTMQASIDVANATEQIQHARADMLSTEIAVSAADDSLFSSTMHEDLGKFNRSMLGAAKLVPQYAAQIENLRHRGDELFSSICARSISMAAASTSVAGNDAAQAVALKSGCLKAFLPYVVSMMDFRNTLIGVATEQYRQLKAKTIESLILSFVVLILAIIIVAIVAFFVVKKYVTVPMGRLGNAMQRLAGGDLSVRVPETDRHDEIGKMAGTVLVFQEAGLEKNRLELAAKQAQDEAEAERSRNEAARMAAAAAQAFVVTSLATGLDRLSAGDLIFQITETFDEDYEKLRIDFNKAMQTLQQTMQHISESAVSVDSSTREITQSSDDMSRRTEQQAASLEQTAAALDEITATVKKSSEGMREAHNLVDQAKTDAERSGEVVSGTVKAMGDIAESSEKISNIIGIIDEIAFQTNLLALNAGVEAARAGEAGRGFAVVATEVRALAQRSAEAAKEIKALISASGAQVRMGVKLVNETGEALGRIVAQVSRLNELVTDMAHSSNEQSTALAEVNNAVSQMDQATQQNAAMAEESTAASHALAHEAEDLRRLVGRFQIGAKTKPTLASLGILG